MSDIDTPQQRQSGWTDEEVELFVGNLLRYGVIIAAAVAIIGGIPYLIANGTVTPHFGAFHQGPEALTTVRGITHGLFSGNSQSIIQFGLLLLIAIPVARVAFSLLAFAKQRDWTYVVVTGIVLGVLLWGLSGQGAG
jgi:uncharacterized membrane protein